ncbi:MAG: hypothetical protein Q8P11_01580 [bacterium]|nr:hypothetical protein [bacterium]
MELTLDVAQFSDFIAQFSSPFSTLWYVFIHGGFLIWIYVIFKGLWYMWMHEIQSSYSARIPKMLLAIRVPRNTEQTPKAVENIFAHLTGTALGSRTLKEKYWDGKVGESFSVELVSRGGFIQYFIHAPVSFRDVIEASIYAQYPDAEVVEVADYTTHVPQQYPDETYETWGTEVGLARPHQYPLKTYTAFEHSLDATFKDPLNSLFEFLGTIKDGEEVWIQIVLQATDDTWVETTAQLVRTLIGAKEPEAKKGHFAKFGATGRDLANILLTQLTPGAVGAGVPVKSAEKTEAASQMQHLSPGERSAVEQIQIKASKPAYFGKLRIAYIAPKTVFNKGRASTGILGAYRQFGSPLINSFKPFKYNKRLYDYFWRKHASIRNQNWTFKAFVNRSMSGGTAYILNTEELATLWHFPMMDMKVPLIQRSEIKTAEPPFFLPMRPDSVDSQQPKRVKPTVNTPLLEPERQKTFAETDVPDNLPFA